MSLPFISHHRPVCNSHKLPGKPYQCRAVGTEDGSPDRPWVDSGWNQITGAGNLGPAQHPLHNNIEHVEPVVQKKAQTANARSEKQKGRFEVGGAHQGLFPSVARAAQVGDFRDRHKEIQDPVCKIVNCTGEIDIHEGKRSGIYDRTHEATDILGKDHQVRNRLAHIRHRCHEVQGAVGSFETHVPVDFRAVGQKRLEKIEEGDDGMLDKVKHSTSKCLKQRDLLNEQWKSVAIQEPHKKENDPVPKRNDSTKHYIGKVKNLYHRILNKWTQEGVVTSGKIRPYPRKLLV
jgi:hypothetical protein